MTYTKSQCWDKTKNTLLFGTALLLQGVLPAVESEEFAQLRAQIATLQQRLSSLEVERASTNTVTLGEMGFKVQNNETSTYFQISPRIQVDLRVFPNNNEAVDGLELRRIRPVFRGQLGELSWRFMPELAGTVRILDAWGDIKLGDSGFIRIGKFKGLIGLERSQSFCNTLFIERGLPTKLATIREIGIELNAGNANTLTQWKLGIYNGSLDDTDLSVNSNLDGNAFDYGGKLEFHPWSSHSKNTCNHLTFGVSLVIGSEDTVINNSDRDRRIRYRSSGQNTFFRYNNDVQVKGKRIRVNTYIHYYHGPFGILSEYIQSRQKFIHVEREDSVKSDGLTLQASWVLTGENASFNGLNPRRPFSINSGQWGAVELGIRYHQLIVGNQAFQGNNNTRFAASNACQQADACALALKWHLTRNLLTAINFEVTKFSGLGMDRPTETLISTRFQIGF